MKKNAQVKKRKKMLYDHVLQGVYAYAGEGTCSALTDSGRKKERSFIRLWTCCWRKEK